MNKSSDSKTNRKSYHSTKAYLSFDSFRQSVKSHLFCDWSFSETFEFLGTIINKLHPSIHPYLKAEQRIKVQICLYIKWPADKYKHLCSNGRQFHQNNKQMWRLNIPVLYTAVILRWQQFSRYKNQCQQLSKNSVNNQLTVKSPHQLTFTWCKGRRQ